MRPLNSACLSLLLAVVAGCAATPPAPRGAPEPVFYPLPPDPPRIQHLATFDSAGSVGTARSGLADFVLGDEGRTEALKRPYGSAFFDGRIYVADSRAPAIAVFDLAARRFSTFAGTGAGRMQQPINITIDADGTKFVTDTMRNQVLVYDRADQFVAAFGAKGEFKPVDTAVAGDRLYVVDIEHHQVVALDKRTGNRVSAFGKPGSAPGTLYHPTNVALGPEGDLYIADTGNFRVSRFRPDGTFVRTYGEAGQSPGTFARPKGIAVDRTGRLYVGDAAFQNVQIFDKDGRILMAFGKPWDGKQGLNLPAGVAIDYDHLALMKPYADPDFALEYLILVVSQFGPNKVDVFGFGRKRGAAYPEDSPPAAAGKR
jgi:DNA-binding beta-propeller fold protein YncE